MSQRKIELDGPTLGHIVQTRARKNADVPAVRVSAHCPKRALRVAAHGRGAVLMDPIFLHEWGLAPFADDQLIPVKESLAHARHP